MTSGQGCSFVGEYDILDLAYQIGICNGGIYMKEIKIELFGIATILLGITLTTNNFFGYILGALGFGVTVVGCFLKDKDR